MVTLRDVAARVGVSPAVVSAAIAGSRTVRMSEATRAKVLRAVQEMGYRTNHAARSLAVRRSGLVAAIVPRIANPVFDQTIQGVYDAAEQDGGVVVVSDAARVRPDTRLMHRLAGTGMADGFLMRTDSLHHETMDEFTSRGIPCLVLGPPIGTGERPHLWVDDRAGLRVATTRLLDAGHTGIVVLGGAGDDARRAGYADAFAARGLRPPRSPYVAVGYRAPDVHRAAVRALGRKQRPTALVVDNVVSAAPVLAAAADLGLRVPEDLSIVAYQDIELATVLRPRITTVRMPLHRAGFLGYQRLIAMINGGGAESATITDPPPELLERDSVRDL